MPISHLHRLNYSFQRSHLAPGPRSPRVLLLTHFIHPLTQAARYTSSLRPIQAWSCRYPDQHLRAVLSGLCRTLDAFSTSAAGHKGEHELCGANFCRGYYWCAWALVHQGKQDVQDAAQEVLRKRNGYETEIVVDGRWRER